MSTEQCLYYGCWGNEAGHMLCLPTGRLGAKRFERYEYFVGEGAAVPTHLDGNLAPRRHRDGAICFRGQGKDNREQQMIASNTVECPEGYFLLHHLSHGWSAMQWWDRHQGDTRGGCNSTILLPGERTSEEMIAALRVHFPRVLENIEKAGILLVDMRLEVARKLREMAKE